jgi:hypothetical protein
MFCNVTVLGVRVLYYDSCRCACFFIVIAAGYKFCIVIVVGVHVLYCDIYRCTFYIVIVEG